MHPVIAKEKIPIGKTKVVGQKISFDYSPWTGKNVIKYNYRTLYRRSLFLGIIPYWKNIFEQRELLHKSLGAFVWDSRLENVDDWKKHEFINV